MAVAGGSQRQLWGLILSPTLPLSYTELTVDEALEMGRKAKKRARAAHLATHRMNNMAESDCPVDVIGDQDDSLLDFKRIKDHNSIDMMLDDLDPSVETLSLPGELCVDDSVLGDYDSKIGDSVSEPCHSDSDLLRSDIFDANYDVHQSLSIGDYGAAFLNSMEHEGILDVKHDPPSLPLVSQPPAQQQPPTEDPPQVTLVPPEQILKVETPILPPLKEVASKPAATQVESSGPLPPMNPVLLSSHNATSNNSNTALAHISKIEPGADGKGYVLHLAIPALGLGNVMLSTEGLTFAHPETKGPEAEMTEIPVSPSCEDDHINVDTDSPVSHSDPELDVTDIPPTPSSRVIAVTEEMEEMRPVVGLGGEVDRFVICSDGPMVCVLCAFRTDSYSAFKSHIICSHPCWRITKKLSKNRLLVEKSVKVSTTLTGGSFNACQRKDCSADDTASSPSPPLSDKKPEKKKAGLHPRKRQLIERNKRLFRCSQCLRLFVFEGSIVNHLLDFHGISSPYDCIMVSNDHGRSFGNIHRCSHQNCFVTCATEPELARHQLENHALQQQQQVVFRCQICGFTADNADAIQEHALHIHHQQIEDYSGE
ncbi:hypothetical protein CAPTEDRAFT_215204 [Capitella teleta]|uniref:C2H2-type domain-containing protein n=1 Tax=Capitella teleta TaxID=283909 RepID=R7VFS2_CAPTE|nr:hypothetical protein CAPTEDRAFT_215204 [Capitella teleta]|eukprot:ELU17432.1 hypothetical protein CAPTEDRAFT_215204 [Capitella teleta]